MTLRGRVETRLFVAATVGLPWVALLAALAPGTPVRVAIAILALMTALGLGWELAYHALQQLRADRDWPSAFALGAVALEAGPLWWSAGQVGIARGGAGAFLALMLSAWVLMWAWVQGPMRVVLIRWRLQGGRLSGGRLSGGRLSAGRLRGGQLRC